VNSSRRSALCACRPDLATFGDTELGSVGAYFPAGGQGAGSGGAGVRPVATQEQKAAQNQMHSDLTSTSLEEQRKQTLSATSTGSLGCGH
jgi:hypothetical protein